MFDRIFHKDRYLKEQQRKAEAQRIILTAQQRERRQLFELQKMFFPNLTTLQYSRHQLTLVANEYLKNRYKVFDDCVKLVLHTVKPDVFFERLKLYENCLLEITKIQKITDPRNTMNGLYEHEQKSRDVLIKIFVDRYWNNICDKTALLKTEKARLRHYGEFLNMEIEYSSFLSSEVDDYIDQKYQNFPEYK